MFEESSKLSDLPSCTDASEKCFSKLTGNEEQKKYCKAQTNINKKKLFTKKLYLQQNHH